MTRTLVRGPSRPLTRGLTRASLDPDAAAYIAAVEAADEQALEPAIRAAYDQFIRGCKADTFAITSGDVVAGSTFRNWDRIKASCILAGARTLDGALVPLVGSAPTNNNFLPEDYVRATGLKGNGSTKFLNSNRNNNADPRDNNHYAVSVTVANNISTASFMMGAASGSTPGRSGVLRFSSNSVFRNNSTTPTVATTFGAGFLGASRSTGARYVYREKGGNFTANTASDVPADAPTGVFSNGVGDTPDASRYNFYSRGEALDLAALDARLATLTAAIASALA